MFRVILRKREDRYKLRLPARLFAITIILFVFAQKTTAQNYPAYDTASEELIDIQRLVNNTLPDIEAMLVAKRAFKPFASVILANDSIADIEVAKTKADYSEDDLKEELSIGALKGEYKVVAIFSDTHITDPETGKDTKAVAVFAEHTNDDFAYLFYYPYTRNARREVVFGNSFGDFAPQVMFKP